MAFHSDIVNQRPQDVQNIIKSLVEANNDYKNNRDQDILIMSQRLGLSKDKIIEGLDNVDLLDPNDNIQGSMNKNSNQSTSLYKEGNDIAKFYYQRGLISEYPHIANIIEPKFANVLSLRNNIT